MWEAEASDNTDPKVKGSEGGVVEGRLEARLGEVNDEVSSARASNYLAGFSFSRCLEADKRLHVTDARHNTCLHCRYARLIR